MSQNEKQRELNEELKEELKEDLDETVGTESGEPAQESGEAEAGTSCEDEKSAEEGDSSDNKAEDKAEEEQNERYLRLMAEFQNFKKRAVKEKADIHAYANEKIIGDLLPVLDNFERALNANASDDPESYAKGMSMIFEQMMKALTDAGVAEIAALGEDFDPAKHNAVMTEDSEEYDSGKVNKVLQKGYTLNNKVIRPTMVSVSK